MLFFSLILQKFLFFVFLIEKTNTSNNNYANENFELKRFEPASKYYINMISYCVTCFLLSGELCMNRDINLDIILNSVIQSYPRNLENNFVEFMNLEWDDKDLTYRSKKIVEDNCYWKFLPTLIYKLKNTVLKIIIDKFEITDVYFLKEIENSNLWKNFEHTNYIDDKIKKVMENLSSLKNNPNYETNESFSSLEYESFFKDSKNMEYLFENQFLTGNSEIDSENLKSLYFFEKNEMRKSILLHDLFFKFQTCFYYSDIMFEIFQQIGISRYIFQFDLSDQAKHKILQSIEYDKNINPDIYMHECFLIYLSKSLKPHFEKYLNAIFQTIEELNLENIFSLEIFYDRSPI